MVEDTTLLESVVLDLEPYSTTYTPDNTSQSQTAQQVFSPTKTLQDVIKHFSPAWFAINMGTGVVSSIFHSYPYGPSKAMNIISLILLLINLTLFVLFLSISIARYTLFSGSWSDMLRHPVQSLYLGCFPMAGATLINSALGPVNQYFNVGGPRFLYTLWAFWWLDCLISFLCCFGIVYVMTVHQRHSMSTLTAIWLLPVVTVIVASTTGQLLTPALAVHSVPHAHLTMGISLLMVVIGLSLSLMILTLYLRRLIIEGLPDVGAIISCFLPIGPCGQGGYSLLLAGQNFSTLLPNGHGYVLGDPLAGRAINFVCFVGAWILWCMAVWWLGCAICAIFHNLMKGERMPFTLGFWGLVFPNGVNALLSIQLGNAMDARLFHVLGSIYGAAVILIWLLLVLPTVIHVWDRGIFVAPPPTSPSSPLKA